MGGRSRCLRSETSGGSEPDLTSPWPPCAILANHQVILVNGSATVHEECRVCGGGLQETFEHSHDEVYRGTLAARDGPAVAACVTVRVTATLA